MVLSDYEVGESFTLDLIEEFPCPRCDKTLRVPKDHSGKIMCPNCEWKFQFPLPPEVDWEEPIPEDTIATMWFLSLPWVSLRLLLDSGVCASAWTHVSSLHYAQWWHASEYLHLSAKFAVGASLYPHGL